MKPEFIDFDVTSMYVRPIKPLKLEKQNMTIEISKTYKLVEPAVATKALISGYAVLTETFGKGEFIVEHFEKSSWFHNACIIHARRLDNNKIEKSVIYELELELFEEVSEQGDPVDLLCKPVQIKRPFDSSICGWVTDQWIEDGVELLNVVHVGEFSVVPRSMVVQIFK